MEAILTKRLWLITSCTVRLFEVHKIILKFSSQGNTVVRAVVLQQDDRFYQLDGHFLL